MNVYSVFIDPIYERNERRYLICTSTRFHDQTNKRKLVKYLLIHTLSRYKLGLIEYLN